MLAVPKLSSGVTLSLHRPRGEAPVMAGPGSEMTPGTAGFGRLRASHADREQVIDTLKAAFVQGRLTKTEFDQRVGQTFTSRTYADLAAVTADLPAGLIRAEQARETAPAQAAQPVNKPLMWGAIGVTVAGMASVVIGIPVNGLMLLTIGVLAILIGAPVAGTLMLDSWRANHRGGQLPPQRIQAPAGEPYGTIGDDRTISEARNDIRNRLYPLRPGWAHACG
jgi:hypothetical protein